MQIHKWLDSTQMGILLCALELAPALLTIHYSPYLSLLDKSFFVRNSVSMYLVRTPSGPRPRARARPRASSHHGRSFVRSFVSWCLDSANCLFFLLLFLVSCFFFLFLFLFLFLLLFPHRRPGTRQPSRACTALRACVRACVGFDYRLVCTQ